MPLVAVFVRRNTVVHYTPPSVGLLTQRGAVRVAGTARSTFAFRDVPRRLPRVILLPSSCPMYMSGVERIDPLRFLAGCRKRRLKQALVINLVFFECVCCAVNYRAPFCIVSFCRRCVICVFCLLVVLVRLSVPVQLVDWKDSSRRPTQNCTVFWYSYA